MKIREEFAEFLESLKHAASGFIDWACWRFNDIVVVLLLCVRIILLAAIAVVPR